MKTSKRNFMILFNFILIFGVQNKSIGASIFAGNPTVQSYSVPSAATQTKLNTCFTAGACDHMNNGNISLYPMTCENGQQCSGCYRWANGRFERVADLSSTGTCDNSNGSVLRVFTAYRMECPNAQATCATNGRLYLSCQIQKIQGAAGTSDNISNINAECFAGNSFSIVGGNSGAVSVSNPVSVTNSCGLNYLRVVDPSSSNPAFTIHLDGPNISSTPANPVFTTDLAALPTIPQTTSVTSRTVTQQLPPGPITVSAEFYKTDSSHCIATSSFAIPGRDLCGPGYEPSILAQPDTSTCQACAVGFYKANRSNAACVACATLPNTTGSPTTIPTTAATSSADCRYVCAAGYTFDSTLRSCTLITGPSPTPSASPSPPTTVIPYPFNIAVWEPNSSRKCSTVISSMTQGRPVPASDWVFELRVHSGNSGTPTPINFNLINLFADLGTNPPGTIQRTYMVYEKSNLWDDWNCFENFGNGNQKYFNGFWRHTSSIPSPSVAHQCISAAPLPIQVPFFPPAGFKYWIRTIPTGQCYPNSSPI